MSLVVNSASSLCLTNLSVSSDTVEEEKGVTLSHAAYFLAALIQPKGTHCEISE